MVLAAVVAVLHGAAVAFLVSGSLLALRWPRLLWLHVPVSLAILGLYLTGSDCPLTTWELRLRAAAGEPGYSGGFIGHYVTEPLGFPIHATSTQIGIYLIAFLPNLVGYGLLLARRVRTRRSDTPGQGPCRFVGPTVGVARDGTETDQRLSRVRERSSSARGQRGDSQRGS